MRFWDEFGSLVVRGALDADGVAAAAACADELAALEGTTLAASSSLVHHERALDGEVRICRVENFVKESAHWAPHYALVEGLVSQAFGEPATLFKDKINYKGPGGGSFLAHQDATAYATDKLATTHISASVAIDPATLENGPLEVAPGRHREGVLPHDAGVIAADAEAAMAFVPALLQPGDVLLFDSFLPHRSAPNTTASWRRSAYLTFNRAAEGDLHAAYYAKKREAFAQGTAGTISINKDFRRRDRAAAVVGVWVCVCDCLRVHNCAPHWRSSPRSASDAARACEGDTPLIARRAHGRAARGGAACGRRRRERAEDGARHHRADGRLPGGPRRGCMMLLGATRMAPRRERYASLRTPRC